MKYLAWKLHPFIFALVSILSIYLIGVWSFSPWQMVRPLGIIWMLIFILHPIANFLAGDKNWGGILITTLVFCVLFQTAVFKVFGIITLISLGFSILVLFLFKKRTNIFVLSHALTIIGLTIITSQVIMISIDLKSIPRAYFEQITARTTKLPPIKLNTSGATSKPDIYYIILDSYPREDILRELFQYDNSDFIQYLEATGFTVPQNAYSNYPRTALSVASTLEMRYWDEIAPEVLGLNFWWLGEPMINNSQVRISLEAAGYQSLSIASNWGITNNETTDLYFSPYITIPNDYENFFIISTPIKLFYAPFQNIVPVSSAESHYRFILFNFDTLEKIPDIPGPKFVISHIIAPHPPFVVTTDGSFVESSEPFSFEASKKLPIEEQKQGYINEIKYINQRLQNVIKLILLKSETPPIIILQADHGSGLYLNFNSLENTCLKERYAIFGAYYLPGKVRHIIPENITPVNIFRIIFNEYFQTDLPLLENRMFFTKENRLFDLVEVTSQIDNVCSIPSDK